MICRIWILFVPLVFCFNASADDDCVSWFKNSGLSKSAKDCVIKCDILGTDMGTFMCHERCEEFCQPQKCKDDSYWKSKIASGRPVKWELTSEVSSAWGESEKGKLIQLLNRLPDQLKIIPFDGFFRMKKSLTLTNPATTASTGRAIVLYDRAFDNPFFSTSRVLVHEFGHVIFIHFSEAERKNYRDSMKWKPTSDGTESRPGDFVSSRARDNSDEDFAENINFFLFEPDVLKSKSPIAYSWIAKKLSEPFKLKEDCQHEIH